MNYFFSPNFIALFFSVAYLAIGSVLEKLGEDKWSHFIFLAGTVPALIIVVRSMRNAFVRQEWNVDILALLSIFGAITLGQLLTASVIAVMLVSGHALETVAQQRAGKEMSALLTRAPKFAHRLENDTLVQVAIDDIRIGDRLLIRSGEIIPVDGAVISPLAVIDESALTGESALVERRQNERVVSGSLNAGPPFQMLASATSANSTYAGIVTLVASAQNSTAPASRLADRYALWFLPISLGLAVVAWAVSHDPIRGLAVLVVATPCPLILAVPVAIVSGMSSCAKRGIVIKNGAALEMLGKANILFFDKTGTLTGGRARLVHIQSEGNKGAISRAELLRLAASLGQMSSHVISAALVAAARERGLTLTLPTRVQEQSGAGITGTVDGKRVVMGSYNFAAGFTTQIAASAAWSTQFLEHVAQEGGSSVFVVVDGVIAGALLLVDQIRIETPRALRLLRKAGIQRIVMLTGDRSDVAESIGAGIDIDEILAEQTPAHKRAVIESAKSSGITIMVGDGINDAPALAAADVGVAMGARGAAASSEAADVVLMVDRLDRLAEALYAARQVRSIAVQSVVAGMAMSVTAMVVAACGFLPPMVGATLQELIDVAVMINALRALRITPLRASQYVLPNHEAERLRDEHAALVPVLERLSNLADRLTLLSPEDTKTALVELNTTLNEKLIPHEREEDSTVYPLIAVLLGGDDPMAAMSRTHQEIFDLGRRLKLSVNALSSEEPTPETTRNLQRILYSLDAILRLHFAQEEEIYQSLK